MVTSNQRNPSGSIRLVAVLACAVVLGGCGIVDNDNGSDTGAVAAHITLAGGRSGMAFDTRVRESLQTIDIEIWDAHGNTYFQSFDYTNHAASIQGVAAGPATITVNARDGNSDIVLTATADVDVEPGRTITPEIYAEPYTPAQHYLCVPEQDSYGGCIRLNWVVWEHDAGVVRYIVERSTDEYAGDWPDIGTVDAATGSFDDCFGMDNATRYYYRIRAERSDYSGWYSNTQSIMPSTSSSTDYTAPYVYTPAVEGSTIRIDWSYTDNDGSLYEFELERSTDNRATWECISHPGSSSRSEYDYGPMVRSDNYYRVVAVLNTSGRYTSNEVQIWMPSGVVVNLAAPMVTDSGVRLDWSFTGPQSDVKSFDVIRCTDGVTWGHLASLDAGARSFDDLSPQWSATNSYQIEAVLYDGGSEFSNTVDCTPSSDYSCFRTPYRGQLSYLTSVLSSNGGKSWTMFDPCTPTNGCDIIIETSTIMDTTIFTPNAETVVLAYGTNAVRYVFLAIDGDDQALWEMDGRPVVIEYTSKMSFTAFTGALAEITQQLSYSGDAVYVNAHDSQGITEWVASSSVRDTVINTQTVHIATDNTNYPGRIYVFLGDPNDSSTMMTNGTMPGVCRLEEYWM